jgi:hypothetical protein
LTFGERRMEPRPDALDEPIGHTGTSLLGVFRAYPRSFHFTRFWPSDQALSPEKRSRS